MLTGDLIDYGRGHWGIPGAHELADDALYHVDRNWFLFYYLIAAGKWYSTPVYTILGNHDWRLNPYPPFAPGAPNPKSLIDDYLRFKPKGAPSKDAREKWHGELKKILETAHGRGHDTAFSYAIEPVEMFFEKPGDVVGLVKDLVSQTSTMDVEGSPSFTHIDSVGWYLLLINPFLDYTFRLPGGFDMLMLDWAEDEDLLFPLVIEGRRFPYFLWQITDASAGGPKAKKSLTTVQKSLVEQFVKKSGKAKIMGIHAPPVGPYPAWTDDQLLTGVIKERIDEDTPGAEQYRNMFPDEPLRKWYYHHFYAVSPKDDVFGDAADYGSIQQSREWLIRELAKDKANVRLVLSGHIHRNGLFVVFIPTDPSYPSDVVGRVFARRVLPDTVRGASPPAVTSTPEGGHGPLYVNTTSAGPRGHEYPVFPKKDTELFVDSGYAEIELVSDGTVATVEFLIARP
jgi:hypothetical protein